MRPATDVKAGKGAEPVVSPSSSSQIADFIKSAAKADPSKSARIVFSLDATMNRQPTWDRACQLQASMFSAVSAISGLSVQLVYFRGFGECRASRWVMNAAALRDLMTGIQCRGGQTQIGKVLSHATRQARDNGLKALIFIGDACEEDIDRLSHLAGELGVRGVRTFMFQEGNDATAERAFREIARLTGGAWFRLGADSAQTLKDLLGAVAIYATGGHEALESQGGRAGRLLLTQMRKDGDK